MKVGDDDWLSCHTENLQFHWVRVDVVLILSRVGLVSDDVLR